MERLGGVTQDGVGGDLDPARFEAVATAGEGLGLSERRGDQESGERQEAGGRRQVLDEGRGALRRGFGCWTDGKTV